MAGIEDVVLRFFAFAESGNAVVLADRVKSLAAAGDEFVRIALVAGVEHELIARRVEDVVQRECQLNDAEVAAEVAADLRDHFDDPLADLLRQLGQLGAIELPDIGRGVDLIEKSSHVRSGARKCNVRWHRDSSPSRR